MEGRTIVRPDPAIRKLESQQAPPSMEGRTIVRPDEKCSDASGGESAPSMEGRTIVRPDLPWDSTHRGRDVSFNGGPDNRPARHAAAAVNVPAAKALQWRAGQSSGQTRRRCAWRGSNRSTFNGGPDNRPARPDHHGLRTRSTTSFNGGPDNRPARLDS